MKSLVNEWIERIQKSHRNYRRYLAVFLILALGTTLGVNWSLHKNGISMTSDYTCGLEEHTHEESCYTHTLTCGKTEGEAAAGHVHSEACYQQENTLTCLSEEHTHGEECYDENGELICTVSEHTHSEECYTAESQLICGQTEGEGAVEAHTHTDACYEKTLTCTLEEHSHTAECIADPTADVETAADWEATLPEASELTDIWAEDLLTVADSQLGYTESAANFQIVDGKTKGYSRYGAWYGDPYGDWCAMYVSFCLHYAGIPSEDFPREANCSRWIEQLEKLELYQAAEDYTPVPGDLIFFDYENDGISDHVGIVYDLITDDAGAVIKIQTIEGNSDEKVQYVKYAVNSDSIQGYGLLPENPETFTQTADTENYRVTVTYTHAARLPDNAKLQVVEFGEDSQEYQDACAETGETYDWLLDVSFLSDGQEVEPQAEVEISVQPLNTETDLGEDSSEEAESKTITHFADSGVESVPGAVTDHTTTFSVGSLSLLGQITQWKNVLVDTSLLSDTPVNVFTVRATSAIAYANDAESAVSDAKTDQAVTLEGVTDSTITASSDKATSDIEKEFTGTSEQDGKVLTDKSVVYGTDDYGAFSSYDAGTFGVTLSALEQEYPITSTDSYKTPIDVVFVLDVSNSMTTEIGTGRDAQTRCEAMVDAVNAAMKYIYSQNEQNRVGIALYSSDAKILLPLDYYTSNDSDGNFLRTVTESNYHAVNIVQRGIKNSSGTTYTGGSFTRGGGTYTQAGIAQGYEIFSHVTDTTFTTQTTSGETITGIRQPVFILLSDGVPTHGTHLYDSVLTGNNQKDYGSGNGRDGGGGNESNDMANKVIEGYYTILSANYYKSQVTAKYGKSATFYSIGEGISAVDSSSGDEDAYANAVLNPSKSVMTILNGMTSQSNYPRVYRLKQMLNRSIEDKTSYNVGSYSPYTTQNYEYYYKAGIEKYPDYAYADKAFFGNMSSSELQKAFESIINSNISATTYYRPLSENTAVTLTDPIGSGMEVKDDPVLRYNGENYSNPSKSVNNNVTTYTYSVPYGGTTGTITVTVTTDSSGDQTVQMSVPAALMPAISNVDGTYTNALPVRLIYQVGLTNAALKEVQEADVGETLSFYTNKYEGSSAAASFAETEKNPYEFKSETKAKGEGNNPSGTNENYFSQSESGTNVTQTLGNNGKLTIKVGSTTNISVEKKWSNTTDHSAIKVKLVQIATAEDGTTTEKQYGDLVELSDSNSWKYTWKDVPNTDKKKTVTYTYEVEEVSVPEGYYVTYSHTDTDDGIAWTITNTAENDVRLKVVKEWQDAYGNKIEDTSKLPEIAGTLYQIDGQETEGESVMLTVQATYVSDWRGNSTTSTIKTYKVKPGGAFSAEISAYGGWTSGNRLTISSVSATGSAKCTTSGSYEFSVSDIKTDTTVTVTISNSWSSYISNTPTLSGESYDKPVPQTVYADPVSLGTFTLSAATNWTKFWTASDLGEQPGHSYSYYVVENTPEGYKSTVVYKDKDNALTPTTDNKTITITNSPTHKDITIPVEKLWVDMNGNPCDGPTDAVVYVLLLKKTTAEDGTVTTSPVLDENEKPMVLALNSGNSFRGEFTVEGVDAELDETKLSEKYAIGEFTALDDTGEYTAQVGDETIQFSMNDVITDDSAQIYINQVAYTVTFGTKLEEGAAKQTLTVTNSSISYTFPSAGSTGTTPFTTVGIVILCLALLLYGISLRRRPGRRVE